VNDDIRIALRQFRKLGPSTLVAVLTLAVAIGLGTTIFGFINALFLRPLPFLHPERVVELNGEARQRGHQLPFSVPKFIEFRSRNQVFVAMAADAGAGYKLTGFGEPVQVFGGRVTSNYFDLLGIKPIRGRSFLPEEEMSDDVALVTARFWQRYLNSDPNVIGRTITLEDATTTIIGVLPDLPVAWFGRNKEVYTPKAFQLRGVSQHELLTGLSFLRCIGRLKPGVTIRQARAALGPLDFAYDQHFPENTDKWTTRVVHASAQGATNLRRAFVLLFAAVAAVLLVACSNVSSLLLIRFMGRSHETAVRIALGADRRTVMRLFVVESLLISLIGGAAGLCVAWCVGRIIPSLAGDKLPLDGNPLFHWPTLTFALLLSAIVGFVTGVYPSWQSSHADIVSGLKGGVRSSSSSGQQRFRGVLIASQVAVAVILISTASMLMNSFVRLARQDPGFRPDRLWVGGIALPASRYAQPEARARFLTRLLAEIQKAPTIQSASAADSVPLAGDALSVAYAQPSDRAIPVAEWPLAPCRTVLPDFFRTLGVPIVRGRDFAAEDNIGEPNVVIISNAAAKRLFPNQDPVGRELLLGSNGSKVRVIGVVADVRSKNLAASGEIQFYTAWVQNPSASFVLVVRSATQPETMTGLVRAALKTIDPGLPILWPSTVEAIVYQSVGKERLTVMLISIFAAVSLLVAVIGVYGAVAYSVQQRTSEIGVRMALGARSWDVLRLIIKQAMSPVVFGIVVGLGITLAAANVIAAQLYEVSPRDPVLLSLTVVVLALAGFLACVMPARRAMRVDPVVALRAE
jgi:predicted permease